MLCFGAVIHLCSSCKRCRSGWKSAIRFSTCCRFSAQFSWCRINGRIKGLGPVFFSPMLILQALPQPLEAGHQVQQLLPQPGGRGGARSRSAAARLAALHIRHHNHIHIMLHWGTAVNSWFRLLLQQPGVCGGFYICGGFHTCTPHTAAHSPASHNKDLPLHDWLELKAN